jgi:hypothetical protein
VTVEYIMEGERFRRLLEKLPKEDQDRVFGFLINAIKWRSWDAMNGKVLPPHVNHATRAIAEVANIFARNGIVFEQYT